MLKFNFVTSKKLFVKNLKKIGVFTFEAGGFF